MTQSVDSYIGYVHDLNMDEIEIQAHHTITGEALAQAAADFCSSTLQDSRVRQLTTEKQSGRTLYTIKIPFTSYHVIFWGVYGSVGESNAAGCGIFDGDGPYTKMWDVQPIQTINEFVRDVLEPKFPTRMSNLQAHDIEFRINEKLARITDVLDTLQSRIGER